MLMHKSKKKIIGIVGGMGPRAGLALHEAIIRNTQVTTDQDHHSVLLFTLPNQIPDRSAFILGESDLNPALSIISIIRKLYQAGAEIIGIPCNTSFSPQIYNIIKQEVTRFAPDVKLVHLPQTVLHYLNDYAEFPRNRIGLLCSNGTYRSAIYEKVFKYTKYELIQPPESLQYEVVHQMIYNKRFGLKSSSFEIDKELIELWKKILQFFNKGQIDALILGCTEFSFLIELHKPKDIFLIDTIDVLAKKLVELSTESLTIDNVDQ